MVKAIRRGLVLLIAAMWEALNQWHLIGFIVDKLRSEGPTGMFLADLITSPIFRLVLIVAGLLIVAKGYMDDRSRLPHAIGGGISALPPSLMPDVSSAPNSKQRIFVGSEITVKYLTSLREGRTSIQSQALIDMYIGKWMRVSGNLADVLKSSPDSRHCQVTFTRTSPGLTELFMRFGKEWFDRLSIMTVGQDVTVVGKIEQVDAFGVHLAECELVN
jgi:hypothetical protein